MPSVSLKEKYEFLRNRPIFAVADDKILMEMAGSLTEKDVLKGSTIIRKGDVADAVFFLVSGKVRVHDGNHVLSRLKSGQVFGEFALFDNESRSASVTAEE